MEIVGFNNTAYNYFSDNYGDISEQTNTLNFKTNWKAHWTLILIG